MDTHKRDLQVIEALEGVRLPQNIIVRAWREEDFQSIQDLSAAEGWPTPSDRPEESFTSWQHAWPALVALHGDEPVGFLRAISDGAVTTYLCEMLVDPFWRGKGLGEALLAICHNIYPTTRIDLISGDEARGFYERLGCREFAGFRKNRLV